MAETGVSFDKETYTFVQQIHEAWSKSAPVSAYARIRDGILVQHKQLDTRIATLASVTKIACPDGLNADSKWDELFTLADLVDSSNDGDRRKRKRAYNEANRLRNLALIAALWSPDIVFYYGWDTAGQVQMSKMQACAIRYPRFVDDFCPRLNFVLLERHRQGIKTGRVKTLNEAPSQPHRDFDLIALESAAPDDNIESQWITNDDGNLSVDADGTLLIDLRPNHFRMYLLQKDRYGVLVARDEEPAPHSLQAAALLSLQTTVTPFSDITTPGGQFSPKEVQHTLNHGLQAYPDIDVPFELSPLQISASSPDVASVASSDDLSFTAFGAAVSDTAPSSVITSHEIEREAQFDVDGDIELHDHDGEQSTFTSNFAFDPVNSNTLPESMTPPMLRNSPRSALEQASPQTSRIRNLAHGSSRPTVGLLKPVLSGSSTQAPGALELTLASPLVHPDDSLTVEEVLHNRYHDMIVTYVQRVSSEAQRAGAGEQRKLRAQWLNPATRWASVLTQPESELPLGKARSYDEADVLYFTSDELIMAARKGQVFRKPVVIKEKFSDSGMHTVEGLAFLLQDASSNSTVDVRWLDHEQPEAISIDRLVKCIRTDRQEGGANALNLRNITKSHLPLLTMLPRFRLLDSLAERVRGGDLGKQSMSALVDVASYISFNILGLAGAFSGAHLDALSGTWVRNLDGVKFWMIVPEEDMDLEWEAFAEAGSGWVPNGKQRFIVLEQDDVLLMPPGVRVVHAVHSPTKCVMEGGILWDDLNVVQILHSVYWICKHQATMNEPIAHQLPRVIAELEVLVKQRPDRFRGECSKRDFLRAFEQAVSDFRDLGCHCALLDGEKSCICRQEGRRCTAWCVAHLEAAHMVCMEEHYADENATDEDFMDA